jgi:hypothetical protein
MTEDQIERRVETRMNTLDRQFMSGELSQTEYDLAVKELDQWAKDQLDRDQTLYTAKRYQVTTNALMRDAARPYIVIDTWCQSVKGRYETMTKAKARARTLNSRNGGK